MREQYEFDPVVAELEFGFGAGGAPAWEMNLGAGHKLALRGRIDRLDIWRETGGRAWYVVMDYKSGRQKLDPVLVEHGVQLQLLGYLAVLRHWPNPRALLGVDRLVPAGVFYVNLRGQYDSGDTRVEALADVETSRRMAYRHTGRFSVDALPKLDCRPGVKTGDQFNYRRNQDGSLHKGSAEALPRFFPAWPRWTPTAKAARRRAGFAIIVPFAGSIRGRIGIACCACRRRKILHEPSALPRGFGLRQSSGALDEPRFVGKAVEGHRSPRRWRVGECVLPFKIPMRVPS
jgi:hypothetical protein